MHALGGRGGEDAQAQVRHHAPDRGFGGTGLAADVGGGVGLGHRNRRRAGFAQDARDFQRSQGAGHQGQGVVVAQVRGQRLGPRRVAVGRHDDYERVRGRGGRRDVVGDIGDPGRAGVGDAEQVDGARIAHGGDGLGEVRQFGQGDRMPGQGQVGRHREAGVAGAQHRYVRSHSFLPPPRDRAPSLRRAQRFVRYLMTRTQHRPVHWSL